MSDLSRFYSRWFPGELNHDSGFHQVMAANMPGAGCVLDLGCGDNTALARYRTPNVEIWGADLETHPGLQHAEWFRPIGADGVIPFADGTFDLVSSFMVMEHVASSARFFGEVARVLKPNGIYVGQSIRSLHYVTWLRRVFDVVPHRWVQRLVKNLYGRDECDTFPTHYRLNREGVIARAARATKLEFVDWRSYASQGYFSFSPMLFRLAVLLDWSLERIMPGLGKMYFTVVLRKRRELGPPSLSGLPSSPA